MKKTKFFIATAIVTISMSMTALAGTWQQDSIGRWYQNDDGSYPVNTWQWIDSNGDGAAESYYFDGNGYCLTDTTTPDGYIVDSNGAWIINGVIQTQQITVQVVQQSAQSESQSQAVSGISSTPYDGYTIVVNTNTKKYHRPGCSSVSDINPENIGYCSDSAYLDSQGYAACKRCH